MCKFLPFHRRALSQTVVLNLQINQWSGWRESLYIITRIGRDYESCCFLIQTIQLTITLHHNGQSMRLDKLASLLPYTRFFLIESQTELILSTFVGIVPVVPWLCSFACFTAIRSEFGVTNGIITMYLFIQIIVKALSVQNSTQSYGESTENQLFLSLLSIMIVRFQLICDGLHSSLQFSFVLLYLIS